MPQLGASLSVVIDRTSSGYNIESTSTTYDNQNIFTVLATDDSRVTRRFAKMCPIFEKIAPKPLN
jgi:hypothetical protein